MSIMAPKNKWELSDMMKFAVSFESPIAIRYPRGEAYDGLKGFRAPVIYGKSEVIYEEEDIALFAIGSMVKTAEAVRNDLKQRGYSCSLINARFAKPIDEKAVEQIAKTHSLLVTLEENVQSGGYGEKIRDYIDEHKPEVSVLIVSLPDDYIEHGNVELLKQEVGIDTDTVIKRIITEYAGVGRKI